jgi:2-oxoglutarate ferredoxin oxidoreductase subunit gamma
LVLVNDATFTADVKAAVTLIRLPATTVAADLGNPLGGAMVMLGAYAAVTGIVEQSALIEAMRQSIPPYRTQHIESNERALLAGWDLLPANEHPAWERSAAHA